MRRCRQGLSGWVLVVALVLVAGCERQDQDTGQNGEQAVASIEGKVIYRERMRLPPGAEVEVELQDISRADAPASTMATVMLPASDGPPYAFKLDYRPDDIDPRHRYALRAVITFEGKLLFTSTDYIDPFSDDAPEILVRRVPREPGRNAGDGALTLEGSRWLLQRLEGEVVSPGAGGHLPDLVLDGETAQAAGFAGCNRFTGSYEREGQARDGSPLRFGQLASTRRACMEGEALERAYLAMLGRVDSFRLEAGSLQLLAAGEVVASYSPAPD